jgi:hypothetical protein
VKRSHVEGNPRSIARLIGRGRTHGDSPVPDWAKEFPGAITVCDRDGITLYMNDRSAATFAGDGGASLLGQSLVVCHPEPSRSRLLELLRTAGTNTYTVEKAGVRKLIHQCPWFRIANTPASWNSRLVLPETMPHHVRAPRPSGIARGARRASAKGDAA